MSGERIGAFTRLKREDMIGLGVELREGLMMMVIVIDRSDVIVNRYRV